MKYSEPTIQTQKRTSKGMLADSNQERKTWCAWLEMSSEYSQDVQSATQQFIPLPNQNIGNLLVLISLFIASDPDSLISRASYARFFFSQDEENTNF